MESRVKYVLEVTEEQLVQHSPQERKKYLRSHRRGGEAVRKHSYTSIDAHRVVYHSNRRRIRDLALANPEPRAQNNSCKFYCQYQVEIGELQTRLHTNDNCMIQIAGNF